MSNVVEEFIEGAEADVAAVIGDVEGILRPRPGGKIDTARRQREAESLADEPVGRQDTLIKGKPVAVDSLPPEIGTARTVTLSANNPVLPVLPRDTDRRGAWVIAIDNDVYLSHDPGQASNAYASDGAAAEGVAYLPKGLPGVPWQNTAGLWAAATTTGTSSRVSVLASFKGA